MRPLFLGVPVFREDPGVLREALVSFLGPYVQVLAVDNGASEECRAVLNEFRGRLRIIRYDENVYVNQAWNRIATEFLASSAHMLVIANADAVTSNGWDLKLGCAYAPDAYWRAVGVRERKELPTHFSLTYEPGHSAGVFFAMARDDVARVFPIPSRIRIWYGDDWIWSLLEGMGRRPVVIDTIRIWHQGSVSSRRLPEFARVCEEDKRAWEETIMAECQKKIASLR